MDSFVADIVSGVIQTNFIPEEGPGEIVGFLINALTNSLILLFAGIIIVAIVYAALAGLKYIRSQGEADKVEEAQNAIRSVLIGVAAVFVGIIAVVLISGIFLNPGSDEVRESLCTFLEPNEDTQACVEGSY